MELDELFAMTTSELEHHGVKGMKWGVRKDKAGSATKKYMDASKKHEGKTKARRAHNASKIQTKKDNEKALAKEVGKKYMDASRKHQAKTDSKTESRKEKRLAKKDAKWEKKIVNDMDKGKSYVVDTAYKSSIPLLDAMLGPLNAKHEKVTPEYYKEYHENTTAILNTALASNPKTISPSGKKKVRLIMESNEDVHISKLKVLPNK